MAKTSRKKSSNSKLRSPKKCSTPILGKNQTVGSPCLSSIRTGSSSTQENARQQIVLERTKQTKSRISKKRTKKRNVRRRLIKNKSSDTDTDWETELEASVHEDAGSKDLPWSPGHTVDGSKLFCDNPESVRDAQHFVGITWDEPILPIRRRNVDVPFENDSDEEADKLLHIDFPQSFETQPAKDHEADTAVEVHDEEQCPTFDPARVVKTYPSAVRKNQTIPIVKLNEECLIDRQWYNVIDRPWHTAYADMLWREFIKNNDVVGSSGNASELPAAPAQESNATSSEDAIMQFDKVFEKDGMEMVTDAYRWNRKLKKFIMINSYNRLPRKHKSNVKDREPITEIRRKYVKRTSEDVENNSISNKACEAINTSTRYRVFELPTSKEQFLGSFVEEKIVIPPPSKKPRIVSVAIRKTNAYKKK